MIRKQLFTVVLLVIFTFTLNAQVEFVREKGPVKPVHKANVGKVVFTSRDTSSTGYNEKDFLKTYKFTPKSDLFITAFFSHSLTNNLHRVAPESGMEELAKLGSYQFAFYVDDKLIHTDNLHPASLSPEEKNTETSMTRPLITHPFANVWGTYLWLRFKRNGGDSVLTEGKHMLKVEIRPYIQTNELKVGDLIATGQVMLDVQFPKIDPATVSLSEVKSYRGLPVSKELFNKNKVKELKAKELEDVFKDVTSVVVLKNGAILMEEYFNNANRNTLHDVRSVGKTFASTMTGIAIHEGLLKSEEQTLKEFYDLKSFRNFSIEKENTTIMQLLTMSAPFEGNDNNGKSAGNEENMYPTSDWVKFTLDLPVDTAYTNGGWHYFTAGVVLLGDIIHKSVPGGLEKYADEKLFKPLNITNYKWQYTPQKVANTAGGIRMNSLDFAKYAQLYKNEGKWNDKQILPKKWVEKSFTKHKL
ncbi:MAG TPA: serine hydrolase, partial [Chitinophagaceae bacterium]|nr:serine hydrolase [Chitinophagaceae bacterium]